ncbi:hypothetical protein S83_013466, partial [Arachis hypogaea]
PNRERRSPSNTRPPVTIVAKTGTDSPVLAATQVPGQEGQSWFQDTADAVTVRQFHWLFKDPRARNIEDVLILFGDHLYRMNYMDLIQVHRENKAELGIDCKRRCG